MDKLKVMTIFGTRPEAIKMAPLVKKLQETEEIQSVLCVTAQHREMLDMVLDLFELKPDYDLNIMQHGQTISDITVKVLKGVEEILQEVKPDIVLVHGDTTTTFVGSLAAFYQQVAVGHVEAGLRSGNIYSPYPEEMNRRLTGHLANLHFAPTEGNYKNLVKEGIGEEKIFVTGNTVIDALLQVVKEDYLFDNPLLNQIDYVNKKVLVMTCHRRENWGEPMENIFKAVVEIAEKHKDVEVIFPVHLNPNIRNLAKQIMGEAGNIHLIEPLDYEPFANLLSKAHLILTDSGGIQEEAPALGKPILVLRTETERPEAVEAGTVKVVGVEKQKIVEEVDKLLKSPSHYLEMATAINPYGDGRACERIVGALKYHFKLSKEKPEVFKR
ncbi:non-hydrolyzing UDP-N-acetylglucosamine 2-epimerase [Clostridium formicaceticum]|uniref:UDP-N-acetylglucosamine 2-epimerase (non-hydrolyzing) n=1 Tax=Clostridium formicaceticum TaxID=1497 RepID=A0AAC9RFR2_9CLOT|nr:UDP-N-acetylglucosamine 2-epimerase (non-hydrolyzing) [Clostridium formicaceticum]AOY75575.1 UDP-N-acetylglucosamine 2-epimerase [Clostridium formicaceticum]ARE85879.1 UDP-N-acetylglucosamine 2-epimerase [Clostridium formicaceticum]